MLARLGRVLGVLVPMALLAQQAPAMATEHPMAGWRDAIRVLASADYGMHSQAAVGVAQELLAPVLVDGLGARRLSSVSADTPSAYFDEVRFASLEDGRAALRHQRQLVAFLQSRLDRAANDSALVGGLTAVAGAGRLSADVAIQDAAVALRVSTSMLGPAAPEPGRGRGKPGKTPRPDRRVKEPGPREAPVGGRPGGTPGSGTAPGAGPVGGKPEDSPASDKPGNPAGGKPEHASPGGGKPDKAAPGWSSAAAGPGDTPNRTGKVSRKRPGHGSGGDTTAGPSVHDLAAAERGLARARQAFEQASRALRGARPVAAAAHHEVAWREAFGALARLGVTYDGDRDGDGVLDVVELRLGSSPLRGDTDGDGLSDLFEVNAVPWVMPASADTDGDGVGDAAGDIDQDGLSNGAEQQLGTDPLEPDTDGDEAGDQDEVGAGTDPLNPDSDADTLADGFEPRAGLDPHRPDTDGDGIRDDRDLTRVTVQGPGGARVELSGVGDVARGLAIDSAAGSGDSVAATVPGLAGEPVELTLAEQDLPRMAGARLTLPYDPADPRVGDPADLRVFYLDQAQGRWRPADGTQTVDTAARTVSVALEHFSTYAVFDAGRWSRFWSSLDNPCVGRAPREGTDLVLLDLSLVLDSSGSMGTFDPDGLRKDAARAFVDGLLADDRAAVVDFDDDAYVVQGLTSDKAALRQAIRSIDDAGGSNIAAGVRVGTDLLLGNGDPDRGRVAVLLTDGRGRYNPELTDRARDAGIVIYTIGLGGRVDDDLLRSIAEGTGGDYLPVAKATELPDAFDRIAQVAGSDPSAKRDGDRDGLTDCVELRGWYDGYGNRFTSNPQQPDTDGDGLTDAEEAGAPLAVAATSGARVLLRVPEQPPTRTAPSDPTRRDRDGDGLSDADEYDMGTPALVWDADHDHLLDGREIDLGTDPQNRDSDRDGWTDGHENNHPDKGLDPTVADQRVSKWTYINHTLLGFFAGELWRKDSYAWLGGNLLSGSLSFIPGPGWIAGAVADLRDTLGAAIHGDWVGSLLSLAGVLPYAGDAVSIVGKVFKFVTANPHMTTGAVFMVAKSEKLPQSVRRAAIRVATKADYDALTQYGFTKAMIDRFAGSRQSIVRLAEAVPGSTLWTKWSDDAAGAMADWQAGEKWLADVLRPKSRTFKTREYSGSLTGFLGGRYTDIVADGIGHEVKVGRVGLSAFVRLQLAKDKFLLKQEMLDGVHWHFMISKDSGTVGPSGPLLERLKELGIPYTIHVG